MEVDLRTGAAFTRFQTMLLRRRFEGLGEKTISYGPCQFPTLGFVVERHQAIAQFIPEDFFFIDVTEERGDQGCARFSWARGRLFDRLACFLLYELVMQDPRAQVVRVLKKTRRKWRPLPLATVELQKLASRKLHISSEQTMQVGGFLC